MAHCAEGHLTMTQVSFYQTSLGPGFSGLLGHFIQTELRMKVK